MAKTKKREIHQISEGTGCIKHSGCKNTAAVKNTAGSFGPNGLLNLVMNDPKLLLIPTIILLFISLCQKTEKHPCCAIDKVLNSAVFYSAL